MGSFHVFGRWERFGLYGPTIQTNQILKHQRRRMTFRNLILALWDQLPINKAFHNFVITGQAWGLFSKNSHIALNTGMPKVCYDTKEKALKAAQWMSSRYKKNFSPYKCAFCDSYHVGQNRTRSEALSRVPSKF